METLTRITEGPIVRTAASLVAVAACLVLLLFLPDLEPTHGPLTMHAFVDWVGHLITALVLAVGIRALRLPVPVWSVLVGGLILDLGHLPQMLGIIGALDGSSRNGSHSLSVVAAIALLGFIDRRRAHIWLGIALGAISHLWRDMGTGTVALMWPVTDTVYATSYLRYLAVLAGLATAMIGSASLLDVHARATASDTNEHSTHPVL